MNLTGLPIPPDSEVSMPVTHAALAEATAMRPQASDVHVNESLPPWLRQGGRFAPLTGANRSSAREMEAVSAWIGGCSRDSWASALDTVSTVAGVDGLRWRASCWDGVGGLSASFRLMPQTAPPLEQLGLPDEVRMLAAQSSGLVIAAGVARSGLTTTLASLVDLVNSTREARILTIEHPVEYLHQPKLSLVSQRDVDPRVRGSTLRTVLSTDPDVVLVGECLTAADFELCLALAAAGHLVLTCVHAPDGAGVCERISAATGRVGQVLLSQVLRGVISQRLLPDAADPRGCHVVAEVMLFSSSMRQWIRPGGEIGRLRTHMENLQAGLDHALASKCLQGLVTDHEARCESVDPETFDLLLRQARAV
ncbi:MAG: ATPase, T2SS/T4P/T4SS family [bacterium]|nr:ATPase, T2SS/T4P/T4SS family [bacterium]